MYGYVSPEFTPKGRKKIIREAYGFPSGLFLCFTMHVFSVNNEPNGTNINTDCGSTHIEKLQAFVKEKGLDVGFAFDGNFLRKEFL